MPPVFWSVPRPKFNKIDVHAVVLVEGDEIAVGCSAVAHRAEGVGVQEGNAVVSVA
jgi:hypothetical protein